ncbi:MAG: Asp-tRNA(Asn)/Glu-tRNA(Gln) amidotransferase subunit GatB [Proteobacteria bacterium]|nr:Asp-tRNA(Asn)/Glu-tRNA(Gln) amidotransferase subunit GatB [Pseudomonadota bacterium]
MMNSKTENKKGYNAVIGLEIHAQLSTKSKMFCSCSTSFGKKQNTNICPVCSGQPGALPSINSRAVEYAVRAALAFNCKINNKNIFARKNYFYPDLPKGYQISQYEEPLAINGWVEIGFKDGSKKKIGITRLHMEEDAGKNTHNVNESLVDLNRSGIPLIEIVSEPDMRTPEEAVAYFKKLKTVLEYLEVCDCNMEEGNLRCDINVSIRKNEHEKFGTKVEIKNLNSFRFVEKALYYEIERQTKMLENNEKIIQETRLFDSSSGITRSMRKKEEAHDYRYFPEPDLLPLILNESFIQKEKDSMPELPDKKCERFMEKYLLSFYDADVLTSDKDISKYYEDLVSYIKEPKVCSNWMQAEVMRTLNEQRIGIKDFKLDHKKLGDLIRSVISGDINQNTAKEVFNEMITGGASAGEIIDKKGLKQISDLTAIEKIIDEVISESMAQVQQYRDGKTAVMGFLVGLVMKKSKGKANPAVVNELLKKKLT